MRYRFLLRPAPSPTTEIDSVLLRTEDGEPWLVRGRTSGASTFLLLGSPIHPDVTGLPVTTIEQKEATVLGAAICAFVGTGVYSSVTAAQRAMKYRATTFRPSKQRRAYGELYAAYRALLPRLKPHYSG